MFYIMVDIAEKEFDIPILKKSVPEVLIDLERKNQRL